MPKAIFSCLTKTKMAVDVQTKTKNITLKVSIHLKYKEFKMTSNTL